MSPTGGSAPEAKATAFPWDAALAFGLGTLRWSPRAFWAATPRELFAALPVPQRAAKRADLARLIAAFPDSRHSDP